MFYRNKVEPAEEVHIFKKRTHRMRFHYIKKVLLLLERKEIVYPLTASLLVLVISGYIYSSQGKPKLFPNQQMAVRIIEHVGDFCLTASIVIIVIYLPKSSRNFFELFTSLYPEGNKLFGPLMAMKKHHFWRNFLISNLCICSLIAMNASFFMQNFGWTTYKYFVVQDVQFYFYNIVLLLLLAMARKLELRFTELNELLEYKTEHFLRTTTNGRRRETPANDLEATLSFILNSEHFYSVRTFRVMHYDLCKLAKKFNEMFGRIVLSTIVFSIANILAKVTFIIDFYVSPRSEEERSVFVVFMGIICFWICANLGQTFLISFYGEQITKEGEKTTRTCFYLLNKVPFQPKNDDQKLVQEELKLFAFQSYSHIPCLSAGGFFDVNFRVLGLMLSSITSYLMVIIQFLLRQQTN